jgi:ankyrin repeat protein
MKYLKQFMEIDMLNTQPYNRPGSYLFFKSIREGNLDIVSDMLLRTKLYVIARDHKLMTPLHVAILKGRTALALKLIDMGADLEAQDVA